MLDFSYKRKCCRINGLQRLDSSTVKFKCRQNRLFILTVALFPFLKGITTFKKFKYNIKHFEMMSCTISVSEGNYDTTMFFLYNYYKIIQCCTISVSEGNYDWISISIIIISFLNVALFPFLKGITTFIKFFKWFHCIYVALFPFLKGITTLFLKLKLNFLLSII